MSGPPRCLAKPRGASQLAGVPHPLRVRFPVTRSPIILLLERLRPFLRRVRGGRRHFAHPPCWDHFWSFFDNLTISGTQKSQKHKFSRKFLHSKFLAPYEGGIYGFIANLEQN